MNRFLQTFSLQSSLLKPYHVINDQDNSNVPKYNSKHYHEIKPSLHYDNNDNNDNIIDISHDTIILLSTNLDIENDNIFHQFTLLSTIFVVSCIEDRQV